jgi:holo-[acyl-carrier protein] synthase
VILGVGIDDIEVERMSRGLRKESGLKERLFTPDEIRYCEGQRHAAMHFAARFAAKEAFAKALGTGISGGMTFREIEVVRDTDGRPGIRLHDRACRGAEERGVGRIHVSLTHTRGRAAAIVILETGEGSG